MYRAVKFSQMYASDGTSLTALHSDRATFLNFVSETDSAAELKVIADSMDLAYHKKSVKVTAPKGYREREMPVTTRVIELVERQPHSQWDKDKLDPVYLAWVTVPDVDGLALRTVVSDDVSDDEIDAFRENSGEYQFGIGQFGDDENGNCVIALSSHAFHAIGPTLGYSVKAMCALFGGTEDSLTFDDQVFYCDGCQTLQEDSDGYTYRFRIIGCETFGVHCGCAAEAELDNLDDFINEPEQQITPETAQTLVDAGKLVHVARYIGGMVDAGRGGFYDGESVDNGQPDEVIAALLKAEPDAQFVCSMDEAGQFQVYWSVYRVINTDADAA